jgi:DNA-binding transcriptional LysR family regulator
MQETPLPKLPDAARLRHLAAVVRCGSYSVAAESLAISQPALSKSVRALERECGVRLLDRGRFGAVPTVFGMALARRSDVVDAELRMAREEIQTLSSGKIGRVIIGCGPSEATRLLPIALGRVLARTPALRVQVLYGLNAELLPMLKHGDIDFALSSIPARSVDPDVKHVQLHEDRAAVIVRRGHPLLAARKPVAVEKLAGREWILARHEELERRALDDMFVQAGLPPPEATIETTSAVLMKTVIMQSNHLTFLPRELVHLEEKWGLVAAVKLVAADWRRLVGVTLRARGLASAAAETIISELRAVAGLLYT